MKAIDLSKMIEHEIAKHGEGLDIKIMETENGSIVERFEIKDAYAIGVPAKAIWIEI